MATSLGKLCTAKGLECFLAAGIEPKAHSRNKLHMST